MEINNCTPIEIRNTVLNGSHTQHTVAFQVLRVPASSAASERVSSAVGRLLEKRRTNLSPATVNSLLSLHSNME